MRSPHPTVSSTNAQRRPLKAARTARVHSASTNTIPISMWGGSSISALPVQNRSPSTTWVGPVSRTTQCAILVSLVVISSPLLVVQRSPHWRFGLPRAPPDEPAQVIGGDGSRDDLQDTRHFEEPIVRHLVGRRREQHTHLRQWGPAEIEGILERVVVQSLEPPEEK